MKAVILAGGHGTRLRPITYEIPKPLVPVKKKPIITHLIEWLHKHGVKEVGVLANREHEKDFERWRAFWEAEMPKEKISLWYEDKRRGTFGGMEIMKDWLGSEPFFFSNGDELKEFDLGKLKEFHGTHEGPATIALVEVPNPSEYGVAIVSGDGKITKFLNKPENPPSNFINSGFYILDPAIFNEADFTKEELMIEQDIFTPLAEKGNLYGLRLNGRWYDCGNLERWEKAIKEW